MFITIFIRRTILGQFNPIKILAPYLNTILISSSHYQLEVPKVACYLQLFLPNLHDSSLP